MDIKVGIIGYGYSGEVIHTPLIEKTKGLLLTAASTYRDDRQALVKSKGLKLYMTPEELIADSDIDLLVVATPHDSHKTLTVKALAAGKHVITEKIMCLNAVEAQEMIDASLTHQRMLSVFHNRRWDGDYLTVKEYIQNGSLGKIISLHSWVYTSKRPPADKWRGNRKFGGGIFSDWGAHLLDQALQLTNFPLVSVHCHMNYTSPEVEVETGAICILRFENGVRHTIETSHLFHSDEKGFCAWGTEGRLSIQGHDPQEAILRNSSLGTPLDYPGYTGHIYTFGEEKDAKIMPIGDWGAYYRNIANYLIHKEPLAVTAPSVLRMMKARDTAIQSNDTRKVIACHI